MDSNVQMSVPFKTAALTGKVKLTALWDVKHMVHLRYMPDDTTMISGKQCETLVGLKA